MTTTETFITIHRQDLMAQCERTGQFEALGPHTYLFVGHQPLDWDAVEAEFPDIQCVVPRIGMVHREDLPQFYDFTGWWWLWQGQAIMADNAIMQQYDMHVIDPGIKAKCEQLLAQSPGMIAMNAGYKGPNWMLLLPHFESTYERGIATRGLTLADVEPVHEWPSTQGTAWRTEDLYDFMEWFEPMWDVFKDHIFAGHLAERAVQAWHVARGYQPKYLLGVIRHEAADCHGTGALMGGNVGLYRQRNAEFMGR